MKLKLGSRVSIFIPSVDGGVFLEIFLVAAVSSVLVLRTILGLTGYLQVGGGDFHIAHMLWGGFFMAIALFILLLFLDSQAKRFAAAIGGFGFGAFIDELGKFITNDYNYFFQPTVALIYVIFVLIFIFIRAFEKYIQITGKDYIINALESLKEVVRYDFDKHEQKRALYFLELSDHSNPIVGPMKDTLNSLEWKDSRNPSIFLRYKKKLNQIYVSLVKQGWFIKFLFFYFILFALSNFIIGYAAILESESFNSWGEFISSFFSLIFVVLGAYFIFRNKRLAAFEMFKRSVLISVLITQFFLFYSEQLAATLILVFSLPMLAICQYLAEQEEAFLSKDKN